MTVGYPLGGVLGGLAAVWLLKHFDWRSVFIFGGVTSALFLPLVLWRLPESIEFLTMKRSANALPQINGILQRMGRSTAVQLPPPEIRARRPLLDIFKPGLLPRTLVVSGAYFLHILTFYYVLGWIPAIVSGLGFPASTAASVSVWANLGGIASGAAMGYAARYVGLKSLSAIAMLATAAMLVFFGRAPADIETLRLLACVLGFFMFGGVVCLYANFARVFPTHVRATGTGFAIGFGRIGGVLGPVIGGELMLAGLDRANVAVVMGLGSVLAAAAILTLPAQLVAASAPAIPNQPIKVS
jgi:MFS family permease